MTDLENALSETLKIRPEDYELYIRALWKSHMDLDKKFTKLVQCLERITDTNQETNETLTKLSANVEDIKKIFVVSSFISKFIKWSAIVLVPFLTAGAAFYTLIHKGH